MPVYLDEKTHKYYCQFRYKDWTGKTKATTKRGFRTKREAKAYETNFKLKSAGDIGMLFKDFADDYIADIQTSLKPSSCYAYSVYINRHILPYFKDMALCSITPQHIRQWQTNIKQKNLAQSTMRTTYVILKRMFNYATKYAGLTVNPMSTADAIGKITSRQTILELSEFNLLIGTANNSDTIVALKLLYYSGMRIGELLALTRSDIDGCSVSITKTYNSVAKKTFEPKTVNSRRIISIPEQLANELTSLEPNNTGYLFKPRTPQCYNDHLKRLVKRAGITKNVSLHTLRHSHASYLINNGIPIPAVSKRLGHSSPAITMSIYAHAFANDDSTIKDFLDIAFTMSSKE